MPTYGAGMLLHRLEKSGLGLRRGAVDFVRQQDVAEDRSFDEGPLAMASREIFLDDVRASDIGWHQIWRELDTPELQSQRFGDRPHHQRLCGAGHPGQEAVSANEDADQYLVEDLLLAHDDFAHL